MWIIFHLFLTIILFKRCESDVAYLQHSLKSCNVGDVIQNECNKCVCTTKAIFECTSLNCNNTKNILKHGEDTSTCHPNQMYAQNLISCICTKDGKWPHNSCHDTFQRLPPEDVIPHKCEPNTYVVIDCNVCKCGPYGVILKNQCTKNICENDIKRRMITKPSSVYGSCETKNWYSLAACQFCYCANENRLVCNTGNHYSKNLELGSYNLVVCGKDLIKDAMELVPEHEKVLRLGLRNDDLKMSTTKITTNLPSIKHMDINVKNVDKNVKIKGAQSDDEYYTDTEEETTVRTTQTVPTTTRTKSKIIITQNPYQEGDETNNENEYESDKKDDEDSSNELGVEVPVTVPTVKPVGILKSQPKLPKLAATNAETLSAFGETLKINLPKVLNKVFQMALRKSMVSLNSESKCTPGATSMNKCNMCFCLKNSKLLCTNNQCD